MSMRRALVPAVLVLAMALLTPGTAHAVGGGGTRGDGPAGGVEGNELTAKASTSRIKVTQTSGPTGGRGILSSIDPTWEPPPCWYEPVFTPEQLKNFDRPR
ncbi:hypothetical protein AB0D90_22285 [Streptomyces althioticus]|uniref:hypothetical protein n=1 Tax=Streptomyces althioticus TaxID=83380 RepID=UPI0033D0BBFF